MCLQLGGCRQRGGAAVPCQALFLPEKQDPLFPKTSSPQNGRIWAHKTGKKIAPGFSCVPESSNTAGTLGDSGFRHRGQKENYILFLPLATQYTEALCTKEVFRNRRTLALSNRVKFPGSRISCKERWFLETGTGMWLFFTWIPGIPRWK